MSKKLNSSSKISSFLEANPGKIWGLRKKILLGMTALLLLLGITTALTTRAILLKVLKTEFQKKGLSSAKSLAASCVVDILTENTSRLKKLLDNEKASDSDTAYIFILDASNLPLAYTFQKGFPIDLLNVNLLPKNKDFKIQLLDTQLGFIYDINVPIFLEKSLIGQVHLGVLQKGIQRTLLFIDLVILFVTLVMITIGILLASKIAALITQPISSLVKATQSIQKGDFSAKIEVKTKDEIGLLAIAFNQMTTYLNQSKERIEELTKDRERQRIAFDLHDNSAQDLANFIKRLELCEKLFKIEPAKAIEELHALKENIRGHLDKVRQVIQGLASVKGDTFDLLQGIKEYINDYQQYHEINLKLDISQSVNTDILAGKSRQIFYIITEALTNIRKHSSAKNVELRLDYNALSELTINIKDDGKGFDLKEIQEKASLGKLGLLSMRQRAASLGGALNINSMPNQGTEILVKIPISGIVYNI
ncbi:MAG: sensor histidine kinase [Candidatus Omnitrophica bacterium]|nr:sensor histidine kinase [Candidatus Omnitrophota bacterium]